MRIFGQVDVLGEDGLAQRVKQEAGLAVKRPAIDGLGQRAHQAQRQRGLEQHRKLAGADAAGRQARERAFGGVAADGLGRRQLGGIALGRVPVVALHAVATAGDGGHGQAVARIRVAAQEAAAVAHHELAFVGAHGGAVGVGDARIDIARGAFGAQRELGGFLGGNRPGVVQVQIGEFSGQLIGVGQAGGRIGGGVASDVPGGLDRLAQGGFGKVGGRGGAAALAGVDRQVQRAVARLLNGLDVVLADRDRQSQAFRDFRRRVRGADLARVGEGLFDEFGKTRVIRRQRQG
ncbi:hypothetical protein D3C73_872630 [compost metagenome]